MRFTEQLVRLLQLTFVLGYGSLPQAASTEIYSGFPVLEYEKICPEFSTYAGEDNPVRTRYWDNNCSVTFNHNATRHNVTDLNLVVMVPATGAIGDSMTQSEPYVQMALQHIEDSGLLPGYRLNAYVADSRCSPPDATANTIRAMSNYPPKHGIVGDGCSGACVAINDAVQYFNVLQLSHTCTSVALSDYERHPFFTRVSPNYKDSVITAREVMMLFGWQRYGLIHDTRAISLLGRDLFVSLAAEDTAAGQYTWTQLMVVQAGSKAEAAEAVQVVRQRDARIVANVVYEDVGVQLMCEAFKIGLLPPYWTQFVVSGWWTDGMLQVRAVDTDCSKEELFQGGYGWLAANPHGGFLKGPQAHGLSGYPIQHIYDRYWEECMKFYGTELGCNDVVPPYFYDAMWVYAEVLHKFLIVDGHDFRELNTRRSREQLFNLSLEVDFLGITGRVRQYNLKDPVTEDYKGSLGDREGPNLIRQLTGTPDSAWSTLAHRMPDNTLVWIGDVNWSIDNASKYVPCSVGSCDLTRGWVPPDGDSTSCPVNQVWSLSGGCLSCPAGEYKSGNSCQPCGAGNASGVEGQVSCSPCAPGQFNKLLGAERCEDCNTGRYSAMDGASECEPCPSGGYQNETGSSACTDCGSVLQTNGLGATDFAQCVCPSGTYHPSGAEKGVCLNCPEGIICALGTDMDIEAKLPILEEGYYADFSLSVFKCLDSGRRCIGGPPGQSCAEGRKPFGRVCYDCEQGKAPSTDGTCTSCVPGEDTLPMIILICLGVGMLMTAYYIFDRADFSKQSHMVLLVAMAMSLLITTLQQVMALGTASISWPGPMRSVFGFFQVLAFDMELFKVKCVVDPSPAFNFAMKVLLFLGCAAVMLIIHCGFVLLKHQGEFRERHPVLVSGVGTVFLMFYVSIFISILAPLQCTKNPNGLWTLKPYPPVVCWDGDDDQHSIMLALGAAASLIPLGFLGRCCHVVYTLPREMQAGNTLFLRSYAFLFFRYKPSMYWYSLFHLTRSLLIALTTIMPVAGLQVLLMQIILLVQLALVCVRMPWRVTQGNAMEALLTWGTLLMLCCAALISGAGDEENALAWTFISLLSVALLGVVCTGIYAVRRSILEKSRKTFDVFLCHHKIGAGCLARYLNVAFAMRKRRAFIDTDDLRDLDKLFDYVATQTRTLCILCTKLIMTRPWCVGEMTTATRWKVHIAKVITSDFVEPDDEFIACYQDHAGGDLSCLTECGISLQSIQDTLRSLRSIQGCFMPSKATPGSMNILCQMLIKKEVKNVEYIPQKCQPDCEVLVIIDNDNMEAACTGFLLVDMIASHADDTTVTTLPFALTDEAQIPSAVKKFLLLCSSGMLGKQRVLERMEALREVLQAHSVVDHSGLPVVADEGFRFPDAGLLEDQKAMLQEVSSQPEELSAFVLNVFKTIAMIFQPSHYGSTKQILDAKAKELAQRIYHGAGRGARSTGGSLTNVGRHGSTQESETVRKSGSSRPAKEAILQEESTKGHAALNGKAAADQDRVESRATVDIAIMPESASQAPVSTALDL